MAGQNPHFSDQSNGLFRVLWEKEFPEDFCKEIAYKRMNTAHTAARMLGYLYCYTELRVEEVVDETATGICLKETRDGTDFAEIRLC